MSTATQCTDWFKDAKWGVFMHFLASPPSSIGGSLPADDWNRQVDAFDVHGLAAQLADVKARFFFLTLGQNSGHFCSPNATYDRLTGVQPSKCSRRDLVAELYDALAPHGIRLLVYLPSHAPMSDPAAVRALRCIPPWDFGMWSPPLNTYSPTDAEGNDARLTLFQRNWEAVIREWSQRWGNKVCGWWFDGCYYADRMYRHPDEPNFHSFAAAVRAGNANSLVAWNPGVMNPPQCMDREEDYTGGEINEPQEVDSPGRWLEHEQFHMLTYLGQSWCRGPIRFSAEQAIAITRAITDYAGVVSWDVPREANGLIPATAMDVLRAVGETVEPTRAWKGNRIPPKLPQPATPYAIAPATVGAVTPLRFNLINAYAMPLHGDLLVTADPQATIAIPHGHITYELAPHEQKLIEIPVRSPATRVPIRGHLSFAFPGHPKLELRQLSPVLHLPELGTIDQIASLNDEIVAKLQPFPLLADGNALAEVYLGLAQGFLVLVARVEDAEPRLRENPWRGSRLEVYLAEADVARPRINQLGIASGTPTQPGGAWRWQKRNSVAAPGVLSQTSFNESGYDLFALIPIAWLLEVHTPPTRFLLEIMACTTGEDGQPRRLGTVFGSTAPWSTADGFPLVLR